MGRGARLGLLTLVAVLLAGGLVARWRGAPSPGVASSGPDAIPSAISSAIPASDERTFSSPFQAWIQLQREPRPEVAVTWFADRAGARPGDVALLAFLGWARLSAGELDEAHAVLERAAALDARCPLVPLFRGDLALERGQVDEALADYRTARAIAEATGASWPGALPAALHREGTVRLWRGDLAGARTCYQQALDRARSGEAAGLRPGIIASQAFLAEVEGRRGEAIGLLEQGRRTLEPGTRERQGLDVTLACFHSIHREYGRAISVLKEVFSREEIVPAEVRLLLLDCLVAAGRKREARSLAIPLLRSRGQPDYLVRAWKGLCGLKP